MKTSKAHHALKAAKAERRSKRENRRGSDREQRWQATSLSGPIDPAILLRLTKAFGEVDVGGHWDEVAAMVLPLLKRVRHPFPADAAPIHLRVPPGVWAGFGIDVGPAWAHVSRDLLARWKVDETRILGTALDNLRRRVSEEPPLVERAVFGGSTATVIQAQGWGSALILAPDVLGAILGPQPRVLLTPVRNALVALPDDLDVDLALAIWGAFADGSPDELDVDPLRWTGSAVTMLDDDPIGSPVIH